DGLLVARHPGREDGLAEGDTGCGHRTAAEHGAVLENHVAGDHASNTSRPSATVFRTRPRRLSPTSHEFAESDRKPPSLTVHSASRSRTTRLARAPTSIPGCSMPNARAGPADMRSSSVSSVSSPGTTR